MNLHQFLTRTLICAVLLCLMPAAALAVASVPQECPSRASRFEKDRFYAQRAADILRAGASRNQSSLARLVAPTATFFVRNGHSFSASSESGVEAIIYFTKLMRLTRYQLQSPDSRGTLARPACTWEVTLLFPLRKDERSMQITFSFVDGRLTKVLGNSVQLFEGNVR